MKKIIIVIMSILLIIVTGFNIYLVINHKNQKQQPSLRVVPYEHFNLASKRINITLNKSEVKILLDELYKTNYRYEEFGLVYNNVVGKADITNKTISVYSELTVVEYVWVLSHEIVHIKYRTSDETFTEYTSIITLYESDVRMFQDVAYNRAVDIVAGAYKNTEYDCGYYLCKYFGWR